MKDEALPAEWNWFVQDVQSSARTDRLANMFHSSLIEYLRFHVYNEITFQLECLGELAVVWLKGLDQEERSVLA